jgi:hypothetical protein
MKNLFLTLFAFLFTFNINAQNLLDNPSFESTWNGLGLPADWTTIAGRTLQETTIVKDGLSACRINGNNTAKLEQQISLSSSFEAGAVYEIRFWYYVVSSTAAYDIQVNCGWTGGNVDGSHNADVLQQTFSANTFGQWEEKVIETTMQTATPSSISFNFNLKIPTGAVVIFDSLSFAKTENTAPFINVTPNITQTFSTTVNTPVQKVFNIATGNLTGAVNIWVGGTGSAMFNVLPQTIPAGNNSTAVTVTYTPTATGTHSAMLNFDPQGTGETSLYTTVGLNGSATNPALLPTIQILPTSWDFGTLQVGETDTALFSITTTNLTDFPSTVMIDNGTTNGYFTIHSGGAAKNTTTIIKILFRPTAAGDFTKQLKISADGIFTTADLYGSATMPDECVKEGDNYPLSTENSLALLDEKFDNVPHNSVFQLNGWKNIAEQNCRAWWGCTKDALGNAVNPSAKVTAYNLIITDVVPYEMWLYTPALNFENADVKKFTFRVMGDYLSEEVVSILELYYVVKNSDGSLSKQNLNISDFPSITDENGTWYPYMIDLTNQPVADVFFMAFRYYCPAGGLGSSQVYYIDDVTWGANASGLADIEDSSIKIFADKSALNIVSDKNGTAILYDILGKKISEYSFINGQNSFEHNLSNGMYIVQIQYCKGSFSRKICF